MNGALRHLLWKDTRMITPLVAVILAGTFVFYLMRWAASWSNNYLSSINLAVSLWLLMPNLMALGAPPMLVGSEEESGTLGWLRALPVPWPLVVVSKTLVAIAAVVLSWAVSSLLLWTVLRTNSEFLPVFSASLLQQNDIRHSGFFSFQLLCVGFFMTYLCRSPVLGLILLVPTIVALQSAVQYAESLLEIDSDANGLWWAGRMATAVAYAVLLVLLPFLPASWRLARRRSRKLHMPPAAADPQKAQPYTPSAVVIQTSRPSMWRALLWQAWRQQAGPLIGLSVIAAICILMMDRNEWSLRIHLARDFIAGVSSGLLVLVCTWTGSLWFDSDSILRRRFFFADRGFPKFPVWVSRLAVPISMLAIIWVGVRATQSFGAMNFYDYRSIQANCVLGFSCGILASVWMARGTLAFFVGPILLIAILLSTTLVLAPYQEFFRYLAIAAIPLLFASWRLMDDWLKQTQGWRIQLRIIGYVLLAVVVSPVTFFAVRFGTMPRPLPHWRAEMLSQSMPKAFDESNLNSPPTIASYLKPWLATNPLPIEVDGIMIDQPDLLWEKTHQSVSKRRFDQTGLAHAARSAQRLLQWAKAARLAVLKGEINPTDVLKYADSDELVAMNQIHNLVKSGVQQPKLAAAYIRGAMSEMASDELREESWRMALAMEWRLYQSRRGSKVFAGEPVDTGYWFPHLERIRADRNVDLAVYGLLGMSIRKVSSPIFVWGADPRVYGHSDTPMDFHVGYGPYYQAKIEQEMVRLGM